MEKWTPLLTERGMKVDGGMEFPTAEQLAKADVLVMHIQIRFDHPLVFIVPRSLK